MPELPDRIFSSACLQHYILILQGGMQSVSLGSRQPATLPNSLFVDCGLYIRKLEHLKTE